MSPQISIFGIAIIAIFYTVGAVILVTLNRLLRSNRWRRLVIAPLAVLVVAAPWADELWIAWSFSELCKDAGVHVARNVEVDGYYDSTSETHRDPPSTQGIREYEKGGYRFYERKSRDKYVVRERVHGEWRTSIHDRPTARYHYKKVRDDADIGYQLEAIEYVVVDSQSGDVIGRNVIYKRYPGWVNTLWVRYFGSGMTMCPDPERGPRQPPFPEAILIPSKSKEGNDHANN